MNEENNAISIVETETLELSSDIRSKLSDALEYVSTSIQNLIEKFGKIDNEFVNFKDSSEEHYTELANLPLLYLGVSQTLNLMLDAVGDIGKSGGEALFGEIFSNVFSKSIGKVSGGVAVDT